ncbi:YolD-like family protein [Paenibacillus sp. S-38]|uniref:YolD-like family protein n=1 Tax=Paenibacillus sp. S-38 TaxID=3416710 RepID=UPI003CF0834C
MKETRLTPGSNMRWSTKFMLPEHIEALQQHTLKSRQKARPTLDEQLLQDFASYIQRSKQDKIPLKITLFDPYIDEVLTGVVEHVDQSQRKIVLLLEEDET